MYVKRLYNMLFYLILYFLKVYRIKIDFNWSLYQFSITISISIFFY
jgi:hypothetical protein